MEAVSRLLAGGLLSGPGIRLVTAGVVSSGSCVSGVPELVRGQQLCVPLGL